MIALLQRVSTASVMIDGLTVAQIPAGLLVLLGVERTDTTAEADRLVERLLRYRVFGDDSGRMNLSLLDTGGSLLVVPQFTLAADTRKGLRPSFTGAAPPGAGEELFEYAVQRARGLLGEARLATGRFGASMQVSLTNDGPVTFWLQATATGDTG